MSFFKRHAFICTNERPNGEDCCHKLGATELFAHAKARTKGEDYRDIRVNKAGCLGRCLEGPVMVIYPEAVWYTFVDKEDMDEIIDKHLLGGEIVERLKI
jgi:(2Fe-2S) ferredoxin